MNVSVVIPLYNQAHLTERCLGALLKNSDHLKEVFIVDNASKDHTAEVLARFKAEFLAKNILFEVITNSENKGFGRACNQGLRKMTGDFLVVLSNDTWLMPHWDAVLATKAVDLKADLIGPYFYEKPFQSEEELLKISAAFTSKNKNKTRIHFVPILMMLTRAGFEKLKFKEGESKDGLFNEKFFVTYEDTDVKERMLRSKMRYIQTGACFIWHHSMASRRELPAAHEQEGLKIFMEIWGFDPRPKDHTFIAKVRRRWWKILENNGFF